MLALILQSALLIAIAYILGCILGCLLRTVFGSDSASATSGSSAATTGATAAAALGTAAAVTGGRSAASESSAKPAPAKKPATAKPAVKPAEPVALDKPASGKAEITRDPAPSASATDSGTAAAAAPAVGLMASEAPAAPTDPSASDPNSKNFVPIAGDVPEPPKAGTEVDNLKLIKGIGPQNEARLNALGVILFQQIADWKANDINQWDQRLAFPGRIEREDWVGQAKVLAGGGSTPFSKRVRRGAVATSVGKGTIGDLGTKPATLSAPRGGKPDNLTLIDGVGNALEKRLFGIGIYHFDQVAALTASQAKWVGIAVGFPGRVERENWVAEAAILAKGGTTEHAKRVEEGKIATSRKSTKDEKG